MKKTEILDRRFAELISAGEKVLLTRRPPPPHVLGDDRVDFATSLQWATSTAQFLGSLFGRDSEYYRRFEKSFHYAGYFSDMASGLAVLKAADNDYSKGYLVEVRSVVEAEVFDGILEQAQHLCEQGYYQAAAVLAGGVLEDTLKKMCAREGLALPSRPKIDAMNAELAKKGAYNTLVQKRITALADLRNKAAHNQWSDFSSGDVEDMLRQIRNFVTDHAT